MNESVCQFLKQQNKGSVYQKSVFKNNSLFSDILHSINNNLWIQIIFEEWKLLNFNFTGEYFVVGVSLEPYDSKNPEKYLKDSFKQEIQPDLKEYYRSYLGIVPSPAQGFENFSSQVNKYLHEPPFNFENPIASLGKDKKVSLY